MNLTNLQKLNAYKAILPIVERDNMMPICVLLSEYLSKKPDEQKEILNKISKGELFSEIKTELLKQNREHFFKPETRIKFIKDAIISYRICRP